MVHDFLQMHFLTENYIERTVTGLASKSTARCKAGKIDDQQPKESKLLSD
jgi:hypothetical protein